MASKGKSTSTAEGELSQQDAKFILECVKNLDTNRQVDIVKVAQALGYKNVASVGNRFRLLRKRHGFPNLECINTSAKSDDKQSAAPSKAAGKKRAAPSHTAIKEEETLSETHSEPTEDKKLTPDPEPVEPWRPRAMMKAHLKGAKVSSKPIPATAPATRNGARASKSKRPVKTGNSQDADQSEEGEGINSHLLRAVDHAFKEEDQA